MLTTDLSEFGIRELDTAQALLEQLKGSNIDGGSNLKIMFNNSSGVVFLGNDEGQSFLLGDNEDSALVELLSDDYGRDYCENTDLRYSGNSTEQEYHNANLLYREYVELCAVTEDYSEQGIKDALESLDDMDTEIIQAMRGIESLEIESDGHTALTEGDAEALAEVYQQVAEATGTDPVNDTGIKESIVVAINNLKVALEQ